MQRVIISAAVLLSLTLPAMAQTVGSTSAATVTNSSQSGSSANVYGSPIGNGASSSYSGATSGSLSHSNSSAQSGVASARTGASSSSVTVYTGSSASSGTSGSTGSTGTAGGGDPTINYTGGYTVRNVPEVIAPSVIGGNPCSVGISAGMAVAGFGITGGGTWADRACERRQQAALLYNIGEKNAAIALMCEDERVLTAMNEAGVGCPGQRRVAVATSQPVAVAAAPLVQAAPPARPVAVTYRAPSAPARPDWCDTTTGPAEQAYYRKTCGWYPNPATIRRVAYRHHPRMG